jgi:hypothetical protein
MMEVRVAPKQAKTDVDRRKIFLGAPFHLALPRHKE